MDATCGASTSSGVNAGDRVMAPDAVDRGTSGVPTGAQYAVRANARRARAPFPRLSRARASTASRSPRRVRVVSHGVARRAE
jgi:hypothetical protein